MTAETTPFDAAKYLGDPKEQAVFLRDALETGDAGYVARALNVIIRARGMSQAARSVVEPDGPTDPFEDGMIVADFHIGLEFNTTHDRVWRCTDVGTRVITAIRVDSLEVSSSDGTRKRLTRAEAEAGRWFDGPPYAVAEYVFDEEDMKACLPATVSPA